MENFYFVKCYQLKINTESFVIPFDSSICKSKNIRTYREPNENFPVFNS